MAASQGQVVSLPLTELFHTFCWSFSNEHYSPSVRDETYLTVYINIQRMECTQATSIYPCVLYVYVRGLLHTATSVCSIHFPVSLCECVLVLQLQELSETVSVCVMRALLVWFGLILKCCQARMTERL